MHTHTHTHTHTHIYIYIYRKRESESETEIEIESHLPEGYGQIPWFQPKFRFNLLKPNDIYIYVVPQR